MVLSFPVKMSYTKPSLPHLLVELDPVKAEWKMFGTFLPISTHDLDAIDKDRHECEEKLREKCVRNGYRRTLTVTGKTLL